MQSSSIFTRISRPVTEVTKSAVINDWENISYWKEPKQMKALENKFCSKYSRGLEGVSTLGKLCSFYPHLNLETVCAALKLMQNYYVIKNISFS